MPTPGLGAPGPSDASDLAQVLRRAAEHDSGTLHFHLDHGIRTITAPELLERALDGAAALTADGVRPGDAVGILGPNRPEWAVAAFSIWTAGATVVPLPHAALQESRALVRQVKSLAHATGTTRVLVSPELGDVPLPGSRSWTLHNAGGGSAPRIDPTRPAVIQLTSGSTARPKGVVLSHEGVIAAVTLSSRSQGITGGRDRLLSWLPLFHDYGLFGFLLRPFVTGLESHVLPVERFARDPLSWFRAVGQVRATVTAGPPSAWSVALDHATVQEAADVDLSSLRLGILAAEMIDASTIDRLLAAAPEFELDPTAVAAAYGLAEATLGVSITPPDRGVRIETVNLTELATSGRVIESVNGPSKRVVSCGRPYAGLRIAIVSTDGTSLPERRVGEIRLQGHTLLRGYLGDAPSFTEDGWLRTGDLGYLSDGELFVTGRQKDVLIVAGRNYAPEDLEWAAGRVGGVRRGRCTAVPRSPGQDREVAVLVEPARRADIGALPTRVRTAVARSTGLAPEVVVVPRGTTLKTTSGKVRRSAMADAYQHGRLPTMRPPR